MSEEKFKPPTLDQLTEVETAPSVAYTGDLVEIEGVVSSKGQSGAPGKYSNKDYDVHFFSFVAWRRVGKTVLEKKLTLLRAVALGSKFSKEFSTGSIHRFWVMLSVNEQRAIIWVKSEQAVDAKELVEIAQKQAELVIVSTKKFGDMKLNRTLDWFEGEIKWGEMLVKLTIGSGESEGLTAGLKVAESLFNDQAVWSKKVNEYAVDQMLPGYNDHWRLVEDPIMTPEQFISRITLRSIHVDNDGRFTFWHDDGDIFSDHSVEIAGTLEAGLNHADMPG